MYKLFWVKDANYVICHTGTYDACLSYSKDIHPENNYIIVKILKERYNGKEKEYKEKEETK